MIIFEDTRNQMGKHDLKHEYFERNGIEIRRTKLYVGDYTLPFNQTICIDTKNSIQELIGDVQSDHERFRSEQNRAQEAGIKLIVLVENEGCLLKDKNGTYQNPTVLCLEDLKRWRNPRSYIWKYGRQLHPRAMKGDQLYKICKTMSERYGVEFQFCTPQDAGKRVIEILTGGQ